MTHKEIFELEDVNVNRLYLHLEGTFWKAYERSAFLFCTRVKEFRILRKDSKALGRDILYLGFPQDKLEKYSRNLLLNHLSESLLCAVMTPGIDEGEYVQWRDAQEVAVAAQALKTPQSHVIEKTPMYKLSYEVLTDVSALVKNVSRPLRSCYGDRLALLAYDVCLSIRRTYDVEGEGRVRLLDDTARGNGELLFMLQLLRDIREVSLESFAVMSEKIVSVNRHILLLRRKATGPAGAEDRFSGAEGARSAESPQGPSDGCPDGGAPSRDNSCLFPLAAIATGRV